MSLTIRPVSVQDECRWRELWQSYLTFYEYPNLDPDVTDHTWSMLCGPKDDTFALVAEQGETVVGFVHCVLHANTWSDKPVCYLEDLFVDEGARGKGVGQALIDAVVERAKDQHWHRVYWRTAKDNHGAQALYDKVSKRTDWVTFEVDV